VGGLFLALSAVVILQTINPNLVELDALEKINVEGEEITTPDFGEMGVEYNPDGTGLYYCFSHDSWGANDYACAETQSKCEDAKSVDDNSYSDCQGFLITEGNNTEFTDKENDYCFAYTGVDGEIYTNCYQSESACTDSPRYGDSITGECQSPASTISQLGGGDNSTFSEEETELFQNEVLANEDDVRNFFNNEIIEVNKNRCENIGGSNCTNVGGIGDNAKDALSAINNNCSSCNGITVTGGTEWWVHSEGTEHKPGVGNPSVDLRVTNPLNTFIDVQATPANEVDNNPCANFGVEVYYISSGDMAGCYHHEVSPTHWHVEFM
jgi:hypothetical protein